MQKHKKAWLKASLLLASLVLLTACSSNESKHPELPKLNTTTERLYIAGISSGGYLTHQLHLAWPDEVRGVAVFAAGPYACAKEGVTAALFNCMAVSRGAPSAEKSLQLIEEAAKEGELGDPKLVENSRVYLYKAAADSVVAQPVSIALEKTYAQLAPEGLKIHTQALAGHGFPTLDKGVACEKTATPYVNACGYSGAAESLNYLDGPTKKAVQAEATGQLLSFNQNTFKAEKSKGLAEEGFYYVPKQCAAGGCGLQVVLHGCEQGAAEVGEDFMRLSGYLQQADARDLVLLFPQAKTSLPNPKGCWDWWGYESKAFATREGPQMQAIHAMWQQLSSTPE
ncbi:extracellular catalytic domain type 2 short-chain-length polyhydroxyalkanoate depolymerase [Marinospirillum minutulum]|uniref:extracellular catalytic domain type 2 short-chain-length polyhydroxyalkanoate depolymerase n=1 Tax=Marinospirillum minutulum TaxID=64974 RepID=UPI000428DDF9|nr:hypothetical protein [Marinospirillum minutulum]